jgi:hypothetical protein
MKSVEIQCSLRVNARALDGNYLIMLSNYMLNFVRHRFRSRSQLKSVLMFPGRRLKFERRLIESLDRLTDTHFMFRLQRKLIIF